CPESVRLLSDITFPPLNPVTVCGGGWVFHSGQDGGKRQTPAVLVRCLFGLFGGYRGVAFADFALAIVAQLGLNVGVASIRDPNTARKLARRFENLPLRILDCDTEVRETFGRN